MINKKGFTLAEVMIALGILGILAAMLIPALMSNTPDNGKVMFKKAYSNFERTVSEMINDNANYPATDIDNGSGVMVNSGFHQTAVGAGTTVPAAQNKFCYLLADKLNTITSDCSTSTNPGVFKTTDGIQWQVHDGGFTINPTDFNTTVTVTVVPTSPTKPACSVVAFSNPATTACAAGKKPNTFKINVRYDGKIRIDPADTAAQDILLNPTNNK